MVQRGHGLLCSCRTPHSLPSEPTSRPMPTTPRPPARRAVIIGAGAIGSHLAASLRDGTPLLIIDPSAGVRSSFAARGTDSVCPTADLSSLPESDPRHIRNGDVVVLATCASVATRAVANVPEAVPVICLANGLIPALRAARNGSLSHGVGEFAVHCSGPGVAARAKDGWLTLERDSSHDATAFLAGAIDPARQRVRLAADIDHHRHGKLMLNSSLDPVAAVIGGTIGQVFLIPAAFGAFRTLMRESLRVASAARWRLAPVQGMRPGVLSMIFHTPLIASMAARSAGRRRKWRVRWRGRCAAAISARRIICPARSSARESVWASPLPLTSARWTCCNASRHIPAVPEAARSLRQSCFSGEMHRRSGRSSRATA